MTMDDRRNWRHPIFLDLGGQPVVVVGGGTVAERKIEMLLASGARITVVSPVVTDLVARWADEGRLTLQRRAHQSGDLEGSRLAYAATADPDVNQAVRTEARKAGIWLNAVDQPALCDFITPAVVRRGHLTLAVSTNGRCPALARQIREDLEREYGPEYADLVERMGQSRDREKTGTDSASGGRPGADEGRAAEPPRSPAHETAEAASRPAAGMVYLVGAGPGDPELLTIKGRRLLEHADTVVYDALVDPRLLDLCRPSATRVYVGKRDGCHSRPQEDINAILIDEARAGRTVVRLKGGDPFVFGRGGEEADALVEAGIRFEVVPGVSAGVGVPAYAGIPLTHRAVTSEVVFVSGHTGPTVRQPVDWARYAASPATLVVFMGVGDLGAIARSLLAHGRDGRCPVAVIENGTTSAQRTIVAPLADIVDTAAEAGVQAPALVVIGDVVALRDRLQWFEGTSASQWPPAGR